MRLLLAAMAVLAGCGSSGHGAAPGGGAGGGPARGVGLSPDTGDALAIADGSQAVDAGPAADAARTFSCQVTGDAGELAACIELDPGAAPDAAASCAASDAGSVMVGACPRATSSGGCHVPESGYTIWWYPPLGAGAVLARCEQMGDSYVSP